MSTESNIKDSETIPVRIRLFKNSILCPLLIFWISQAGLHLIPDPTMMKLYPTL